MKIDEAATPTVLVLQVRSTFALCSINLRSRCDLREGSVGSKTRNDSISQHLVIVSVEVLQALHARNW